ncbi:hypothetical protein V6N11_052500 [Hibiscus sabdariffa]|uniref:Uncharacterized protein n=1 Tax=Hibiscus sabdariffa TaxID=183260 RepID=A0ABR2UA98_9ROSI
MRSWNSSAFLFFVSLPFFLLVSPSSSSIDSQHERIRHRVLMSFKEISKETNHTFDCSPSGPCVPCLYSEKSDKKYRCSETGYRIPFKCVETDDDSKAENKQKTEKDRVGHKPTSPIEAVYLQLMKRSYQYSVLRELFLAYCSLVVQLYSYEESGPLPCLEFLQGGSNLTLGFDLGALSYETTSSELADMHFADVHFGSAMLSTFWLKEVLIVQPTLWCWRVVESTDSFVRVQICFMFSFGCNLMFLPAINLLMVTSWL